MSPTSDGQAFYDHATALLQSNHALENLFRSEQSIETCIRIDAPTRIGRRIIAPALPDFLQQWPRLKVDLCFSDRTADLTLDQIDIALRIGRLPDSDLKARRIGELRQINVASPAYLDKYGTPRSLDDLQHHFQVAYAAPNSGRITGWEYELDGHEHDHPVPWRVSANNAEAYIACALSDLGMIQIPAYDVADDLAAGRLIEILPEHRPPPLQMHLVFMARSQSTPRIARFSDWLAQTLQQAIQFDHSSHMPRVATGP